MKIRPATIPDVPKLVALNRIVQDMHANAFPERYRRDAPEQVVADAFTAMIKAAPSYWLVAEEGQPVGFLSAEFREQGESWYLVPRRVCYLAAIVVASGARHKGIARALVAALQREANARGVASIELDVWAFNGEAREAFIKLGFQPLMEKLTLSVEGPNSQPV